MLLQYELGFEETENILEVLQGWNAYASLGNTYQLRQRLTKWVEDELKGRTKAKNVKSSF